MSEQTVRGADENAESAPINEVFQPETQPETQSEPDSQPGAALSEAEAAESQSVPRDPPEESLTDESLSASEGKVSEESLEATDGASVTDLTVAATSDEESVERKLANLLRLADKDLRADRLTSPRGYNAWEKYKRVLELDADNEQALLGFEKITARYTELALKAASNQDFERANEHVEKAAVVTPDAPVIAVIRRQIQEIRQSEPEESPPPETRLGATQQPAPIENETNAVNDEERPVAGPPFKLALVRFESADVGANFDGQLALELQRSIVKHSQFVVSDSYYADGTFREDPINQAELWDPQGTEKIPNLNGLIASSGHLNVDGLGLCWWQAGANEDNPELTRVTVYFIDVHNRQLYQAKGRWAEIDGLVEDVANQFLEGRLPVG